MATTTKRKKTGGRKKGTPNKRTTALQEAVAEQLKSLPKGQVKPLNYFLALLNSKPPKGADPLTLVKHEELRFAAAQAAAPYTHPRLSAIDVSGSDNEAVQAVKNRSRDRVNRLKNGTA